MAVSVSDDSNDNDDHKLPCSTADPDIPNSSEFIPPESFWLSKDSEYDWFDRNAFLERKESTKGNLNPSVNPSYSRSNSQKFSFNLKSKPAIIGLPKSQKNTHVDSNRRQCKPANFRLFPKRPGSAGRTSGGVPVTEPSSPKVSCIGRVRSKRCSSRRRLAAPDSQPVSQCKKTGLISRIASLFRSDGNNRRKNKSSVKVTELSENSYSRKNTVKPVNSEPATPPDPPVLGGLNRFASGRRSETWTDDIDTAVSRWTT